MRFLRGAEGRDLNPRRTQTPETVFETFANGRFAGMFVLMRQFVRQCADRGDSRAARRSASGLARTLPAAGPNAALTVAPFRARQRHREVVSLHTPAIADGLKRLVAPVVPFAIIAGAGVDAATRLEQAGGEVADVDEVAGSAGAAEPPADLVDYHPPGPALDAALLAAGELRRRWFCREHARDRRRHAAAAVRRDYAHRKGVAAGLQPRGDEVVVVVAVRVGSVMLDPAELAVDQEVDFFHLRLGDPRKAEPVDAVRKHRLSGQRRAYVELLLPTTRCRSRGRDCACEEYYDGDPYSREHHDHEPPLVPRVLIRELRGVHTPRSSGSLSLAGVGMDPPVREELVDAGSVRHLREVASICVNGVEVPLPGRGREAGEEDLLPVRRPAWVATADRVRIVVPATAAGDQDFVHAAAVGVHDPDCAAVLPRVRNVGGEQDLVPLRRPVPAVEVEVHSHGVDDLPEPAAVGPDGEESGNAAGIEERAQEDELLAVGRVVAWTD